MINIDTRLLERVDSDELWLLIHIVKRFDERLICWPSNKTLVTDTGWSMKKMQAVKGRLIDKKILIAKPRFKADSQSSNEYTIDTDLLGVFVPAKRMTVGMEDSGTSPHRQNLPTPPESKTDSTPESKRGNEVLTTEVLFPSDEGDFKKSALNTESQLTPEKEKPAKKKKEPKPADECYTEFVKMWCEAYPDLGFDGVSGVKINSMIKRTRERLTASGKVADKETVISAFAYVLAYVKRENHFVHGKPITTFDQQYNSVVREIKEGKPAKKQQMPSSAVFSKYSNLT